MSMEFPKEYAIGTVIRTITGGLEGIIISDEAPVYGFKRFAVEMRHGETELYGPDMLLPADHPVHRMLDEWHAAGRQQCYSHILIGFDSDGNWKHVYGHSDDELSRVSKTVNFWARYFCRVRAF